MGKNTRASAKTIAQASLEYILTYGWMLTLLAVIVTLMTANIQPQTIFGVKCISREGFLVQAVSISTEGLQANLANSTGQKLNYVLFQVLDKDEVRLADFNTSKWERGETKPVSVSFRLPEGFFNIFLRADYPIQGITKTSLIECRGYAPEMRAQGVEYQENLIGYWKLNENNDSVIDSSGYAQDGTVNGTVIRGQTGKEESAYNFNGTGFVRVPQSDTLKRVRVVTLMAWVKANNNFLQSQGIAGMTENGGTGQYKGGYFLSTYWDGIEFGYKSAENGWADWAECQRCLQQNVWQHIAGTYDGTRLKIYVNGILRVNKGASIGFNVNQNHTAPFYIGQAPKWHWATNTSNFSGFIDNVRVYNRALNATEIQTIYNNQK